MKNFKLDKQKKYYILVSVILCVFVIIAVVFSQSFALFKKQIVAKDINIHVAELNYALESDKLTDNSITVGAYSFVDLEIKVTSLNDISSKYELVFNTSDVSNIEVGYYDDTANPVLGVIEGGGSKTISLKIINHNSASIDVSFLVEGGFEYNELEVSKGTRITKEFARKVPASEQVFASSSLGENCKTYDDGVDTFLVGQCSKNYVWYSGKLWRVVLKNNQTGAVKMVTDNAITSIAYNTDNNPVFEYGYVDQLLHQEFLPTLHDYKDYLVLNSAWNIAEDASDAPTRPAGTNTIQRTVGLLNAYEYYTTYHNSDDLVTVSLGYLNNHTWWWLITPASSAVRFAYPDSESGIDFGNPAYGRGVRPALNLKGDVRIISGMGTETEPYRLEGDQKEVVNGTTLLSTRYSGEYITFHNSLYRIVAVEEGLTKITAVSKLAELASMQFHSEDNVPIFTNASIKTDLESYYQNSVKEPYKSMIETNTKWYLGLVGSGGSYKSSICATVDFNVSAMDCVKTTALVTTNVGLPRVGEMFTSNIIKGNKDHLWTLTPMSSAGIGAVHFDNLLASDNSSNKYLVRPSMYLKSNVVISKTNTGDGTYDHPYNIELGTQ